MGKDHGHGEPDDDDGNSNRSSMIGLAVIVVLGILAWWLVSALHDKSKLEDCLMSGRHDCAPIVAPSSPG
jgi:heme/copper-type cytochrome/quinol oxidase subunit 4